MPPTILWILEYKGKRALVCAMSELGARMAAAFNWRDMEWETLADCKPFNVEEFGLGLVCKEKLYDWENRCLLKDPIRVDK